MIIKEYLPNPVGRDTDGEYILLSNSGEQPVNLNGWYLQDEAGKQFNLNGSVNSGEDVLLLRAETKIALNNTSETLYLFNQDGDVVHQISHSGQAREGLVITYHAEITPELRAELFENISYPESIMPTLPLIQLLFTALLIAVTLASLTHIAFKSIVQS